MRRRRPVAALLGLSALTVSISELAFWGQPGKAFGEPVGVVLSVLAYGVLVVAVVGILERVRPAGWGGVFLGGALLGWGAEGIIAATTYLFLPVSISLTALSWHALISVGWAWAVLPRWTRSGWRGLLMLAGTGVLWGLWGAFQAADSGELAPAPAFAAYVLATSVVFAAGLVVWSRRRSDRMVGDRTLGTVLAVIGLGFVVRTITIFWAPAVLVPLVLLAVQVMRRQPRGTPAHLAAPTVTVRAAAAGTAAMAVAAVLVYALALGTPVAAVFGPLAYAVTAVAGAVLLARLSWTAFRRQPSPAGP